MRRTVPSRAPRRREPASAQRAHDLAARAGAVVGDRARVVAPAHYALARHRPSRGLWVFAIRGETVVGVCGPLDGDPPPAWLLPHFDFSSPAALANLPLVRAHLAEFERLA